MQAYDTLPALLRVYVQEHDGPVLAMQQLLDHHHWRADEVLAWVRATHELRRRGHSGSSAI